MDVYIESLMTPNSFLQFKIGNKLDISSFVIAEDYNPIGECESAYNFFNQEIDVEVTEKNNLICSFDVLLRNQENELYLGVKEGNRLNLNKCTIDTLISYLNQNKLMWRFENILAAQSISIVYYTKLKMLFYFDFETNTSLSLIHISK